MTELDSAIIAIVRRAGATGVPMGQIVDRLVQDGADEKKTELAVWSLIQRRALTPAGFVCRTLQEPSNEGGRRKARCYEFLLIPWSPEQDQQIEMPFDGSTSDG